jgi:glycosyltransferase involved in cell wall biosynthesis
LTIVHLGHVSYELHHHRALFEEYARRARFLYLEVDDPGGSAGDRLPRRSLPNPTDLRAGPEIVSVSGSLPGRRFRTVNQWNWWLAARAVLRALRRGKSGPLILVSQTPDLLPTLRGLPADATVYLVIDDYAGLARDPVSARHAARGHRRMARAADVALAISLPLAEDLRRHRGLVYETTTGVDFATFAAAADGPIWPAIAALPEPRVGLIGNLNDRIDWPLIEAIARRRPDWHIVLVGPVHQAGAETVGALSTLSRLANVHRVPEVPAAAIGSCATGFNVCLIAYRAGAGTDGINPLKLYQYLAAGRPVVASPLPALESFRDVIGIGRSKAEFESQIALALAGGSDLAARAQRQERVRAYDWARIAEQRLAIFRESISGPGH